MAILVSKRELFRTRGFSQGLYMNKVQLVSIARHGTARHGDWVVWTLVRQGRVWKGHEQEADGSMQAR